MKVCHLSVWVVPQHKPKLLSYAAAGDLTGSKADEKAAPI